MKIEGDFNMKIEGDLNVHAVNKGNVWFLSYKHLVHDLFDWLGLRVCLPYTQSIRVHGIGRNCAAIISPFLHYI